MAENIKHTIIDIVLLFLLIMALVGYSEAIWPWMPEINSREHIERATFEFGLYRKGENNEYSILCAGDSRNRRQ